MNVRMYVHLYLQTKNSATTNNLLVVMMMQTKLSISSIKEFA